MIKHWTQKQMEDADKVFAPKILYDKENDILSIFWFPQLDYDSSIETTNGFIFDISKKPEEEIKGIEIHNFMSKIKTQSKSVQEKK